MLQVSASYAQRASERQNSFRPGRNRTLYSIYHNHNAMKLSWSLRAERGEMVLAWKDTISITAFKRDLYTVDLICLAIRLKENKTVEINEDMDGWKSLVEQLPVYLPGCQKVEEWFDTVAFPAFKPNSTVIFRPDESDEPTKRRQPEITVSPGCSMFL